MYLSPLMTTCSAGCGLSWEWQLAPFPIMALSSSAAMDLPGTWPPQHLEAVTHAAGLCCDPVISPFFSCFSLLSLSIVACSMWHHHSPSSTSLLWLSGPTCTQRPHTAVLLAQEPCSIARSLSRGAVGESSHGASRAPRHYRPQEAAMRGAGSCGGRCTAACSSVGQPRSPECTAAPAQ